jgi:hypothetical protein
LALLSRALAMRGPKLAWTISSMTLLATEQIVMRAQKALARLSLLAAIDKRK